MTPTQTLPHDVDPQTAEVRAAQQAEMDRDYDEMRWDAIADALAELHDGQVERAEAALRRVL